MDEHKNTLNPSQLAALDAGRHISLTAGAGTGKTSVLVHRYLGIIEQGRAGVSGILALTFTEKAAAEMKIRVRRAIDDKISDAASKEQLLDWEKVLEDFREPRISTFHALCASMLREFPVRAGVDPAFKVLDESETRPLVEGTLDTFIEKKAAAGDERLSALASIWGRARIKGILSDLISARMFAAAWAEKYARMPAGEAVEHMKSVVDAWMAARIDRTVLGGFLNELQSIQCRDKNDLLAEHYFNALRTLDAVVNHNSNGLSPLLGILLRGGKSASWSDVKKVKAVLGACRDYTQSIGDIAFTAKDERAAAAACALSSLFIELLVSYRAAKGNGVLLDFDDLEEKTLFLLDSSPEVRAALNRRFKYVLVDEFQDTNEVQWSIIGKLAAPADGGRFSSNVFIVGDEKQSIYAFRGADVTIFDKARKTIDEANSNPGGRMELDTCYRSHPALLRFFNGIFPHIFRGAQTAEKESQISYTRLKTERRDEGPHEEPRIEILKLREGKLADAGTDSVVSEDAEPSSGGGEAEMVALRIRHLAQQGIEISVKGEEASRKLRYGDVAVLFRSRTRLDLYKEALKAQGIRFNILGGLGFYSCREVLDLINIIEMLAHPCNDISLAGVLRSPYVCISDEDLLAISMKTGKFFNEKLAAAAVDTSMPGRVRISTAYKRIEKWKGAAGRIRIGELLRRICADSGIFGIIAADPFPAQERLNIEKLIDMADRFERSGYCSISSFSDYLNEAIGLAAREAEAVAPGEDLDAVKLMTIHAAKGLEFPVVVIPGMSIKYSYGADESIYIGDIGAGEIEAGFTAPDPDNENSHKASALRGIIGAIRRKKTDEEYKRLFYVACTRARERLIFAGVRAELLSGKDEEPSVKTEQRWDSMLAAALRSAGELEHPEDNIAIFDETEIITECKPAKKASMGSFTETAEKILAAMGDSSSADDKMKYLAPLPRDAEDGMSFSVTEVVSFLNDKESYIMNYVMGVPAEWNKPVHGTSSAASKNAIDPMARGTIVHRVFEEYTSDEHETGEKLFARILNEAAVTGEASIKEFTAHYLPKLAAFAESDTGRAISSAEVYRELETTVLIGRWILTGAIDLAYKRDGEWRIIDYKTDRITASEIPEKAAYYKLQLQMYALALMKIIPGIERVSASIFYVEPGEMGETLIVKNDQTNEIEKYLTETFEEMESLHMGAEDFS